METTEKIVESYCRYVKGWFTLPNVKCQGQHEIDLLAVDASSKSGIRRYHIESRVSISGSYSKLTAKEFSLEKLRQRVEQAGQRSTIDFFIERKFGPIEVLDELRLHGFTEGHYEKVIVTWDWTDQAGQRARESGITLWKFGRLLEKIDQKIRDKTTYFTDDTLRTIQLFVKSVPPTPAR
jgi:hypothetical protein